MSRLSEVFKNHKAFIPFIVANYPDAASTVKNVVSLAQNGADIIELGIPFSDPIADGPVIQAADVQALKKGDLTTDKLFEMVQQIRQQTDIPLVFLTYLNIVYRYGYQDFTAKCADVGVDGLVIPDLPLEEQSELTPIAKDNGVDIIPLVTPTSEDRVPAIARSATGFIYVVSSLGVTGERSEFDRHLKELLAQIHQATDTPAAIGFGIHTPEQAKSMAKIADGVIIGSACVKITQKEGNKAPEALGRYAQTIKQAI